MNSIKEGFKWHCHTTLYKYNNENDLKTNKPLEIMEIENNMLLTKGAELLWKLLNGQMDNETVFGFTRANSYLGVGTSSTAESAEQTSLIGAQSGNVAYAPMDTSTADSYPLIQNNKITFRAEFGGNVANFAWNEFGVLNGDPSNPGTRDPETIVLLNRKVPASSLGTKIEGSVWVMVVSLTIN